MRYNLICQSRPIVDVGYRSHLTGVEITLRRVAFTQRSHCVVFYRVTNLRPTHTTSKMPHSVTPESTPADGSSRTISQVDSIKLEPESQDVAMDDAPNPATAEKPKVNLEALFEDEDSDDEFPSSAPAVKSEEESSQPAPMYVTLRGTH
jgi:hypothetical protein